MKNRKIGTAKAGEPCQDGNVAALSLNFWVCRSFFLKRGVMKHNYEIKIYHADTDCYGIVWHGNYLRFCEQARCDFVEAMGKSMKDYESNGIYTPLIEANIKYKHAAKVHDVLNIETSVETLSPLRATMLQKITNKLTGQDVAEVTVSFVCTDTNGNLMRKMPQAMFDMLDKMKNS